MPPAFSRYYGAEEAAGVLEVIDNLAGGGFALNIPNVFKVVVNKGDTVALAMVRNSNVLYRVFKLNQNQYPNSPSGYSGHRFRGLSSPTCFPSIALSPCLELTTSPSTFTSRSMARPLTC